MAMQYINYIKAKTPWSTGNQQEKPVLSDEDEQFLNRITSQEGASLPLPDQMDGSEKRVKDAQTALMDGAQNIALPDTPTEEPQEIIEDPEKVGTSTAEAKPRKYWTWLRRDSRDAERKKQEATAASLMDVAEGVKSADAQPNEDDLVADVEAKKEEEDMSEALERLNLAAVNNRVFSISAETQELLEKFNLVFKDLVNGVPTAYDDLERLLTNSDRQLQSTFKSLPSFLQKLIESLPSKMTKGFAPEIMAAAAERASRGGVNMENAGKAAAAASKLGFKTPSLKDLIGKPGAAAGALRSVIQYLRARFPAFMGMNVLWSLAMFVLLLVFWYCHKRGREVRLEKERQLTDDEVARLDAQFRIMHPDGKITTTADVGASKEEVQAGIEEVEAAHEAARVIDNDSGVTDPDPSTLSTTVQPAEKIGT